MQAASGYAFTGVVEVASSQVRVSGEFQAPDRIHEVVTSPNGARAEVLLIGSVSFLREAATSQWHRSSAASAATDPRTAFSVLKQATGVRRSGVRYLFRLPTLATSRLLTGGGAAGPGSGMAVLADHSISSLQVSVSAAGRLVTVSLYYSAIGTAPPVTAPSGG